MNRQFPLSVLLLCALSLFPDFAFSRQSVPPGEGFGEASFRIKWVESFSSKRDFGEKSGFAKGLFNFILGRKEARLVRPINLTGAGDERVWVLDQGGRFASQVDFRKRRFDIKKFSGFDAFPSLVGICRGTRGRFYFSDSALKQVFVVHDRGKKIRPLSEATAFSRPTGLAFSPETEELWVVDTNAHQLLVFNESGQLLRKVGRRGTEVGQFNFPTFICIGPSGRAYVVDSMNFRVQIFESAGNYVSSFGEAGDATGYFARPKGIAIDSYRHIYVVDGLFCSVQVFGQSGEYLARFGTRGRGAGEFWLPVGIFVANNNRIYVADSYNSRIQIFELAPKSDDE